MTDEERASSNNLKAIVAGAHKFAEEKRALGWTRQDAIESLKKMLESDTGDDDNGRYD